MPRHTSKPPALVSGCKTGELRGVEQEDSTSNEWQPLSRFNSTRTHRLPLSNTFAEGYPSVYAYAPTVCQDAPYQLVSDDALGAVLHSPCSAMFHVIRRWRVAQILTHSSDGSQAA